MNRLRQRSHMIDVAFTLTLFCVFAASCLMVVLIGAGVYGNTVERMERNYDTRATITYVFTKLKQNDSAGAVSVQEIEGTPALVLTREMEGSLYSTWIYHHEGAVWEIFARAEAPVSLSQGQYIAGIHRFDIAMADNGLLHFTAADQSGREASLSVSPRC